MVLAIIKIRGHIGSNPDVKKTLEILGLHRVNHCVFLAEGMQSERMLLVCDRYLTWGTLTEETIKTVIAKRGEKGSKRASEIYDDKKLSEIASKVSKGEAKLAEFIDRVLRLTPPKKGYGSVKHRYPKGALAKRDNMDLLIKSMI